MSYLHFTHIVYLFAVQYYVTKIFFSSTYATVAYRQYDVQCRAHAVDTIAGGFTKEAPLRFTCDTLRGASCHPDATETPTIFYRCSFPFCTHLPTERHINSTS
jgi:hypothetical protein